jgi:hypothetical protein
MPLDLEDRGRELLNRAARRLGARLRNANSAALGLVVHASTRRCSTSTRTSTRSAVGLRG